MKRNHRILIGIIILIGLLFWIIPTIVFGWKVQRLKNELSQNAKDWARCELLQKTSHEDNVAIRAKLDKLLGSDSFQSGATVSTLSNQTATQKLDQYLSGTQTESVSQSQQ